MLHIPTKEQKRLIFTGLLFIFLGILLGAFGAHVLKEYLSAEKFNSFETGVRYQIYHGLGLLIVVCFNVMFSLKTKWVSIFMTLGVFCFSFSIYILSLKDLFSFPIPKIFALFTPIGGLFLLFAWLLFFIEVLKIKNKN
ncbi:MAG: DUF423 domain-containing protein [Flavobacteriia bacterium]|nr:DUF423 domain-containing protein [Flavobacteriia bacterium]